MIATAAPASGTLPSFNTPDPSGFSFGGALSDLWDVGLQTIQKWADYEEPATELALNAEAQASQQQVAAAQAPQAQLFGLDRTLVLVGGGFVAVLGLVLLLRA